MPLFDAGNVSATACLNVGGRLLETDAQGRVVHAHPPGQRIVDALFGAGTNALALTAGQLAQVARRMAALIVEVIDGTLLTAGAGADANRSTACGYSAGGDYPFRRSGGVLPPSARRSFLFFRYRAAAGHGPARASAPA